MNRFLLQSVLILSVAIFGKSTFAQAPGGTATNVTADRTAKIRALVDRQVQAWEKHDFGIAAGDWLPDGELTSPGGHVTEKDMQAAITGYFEHFKDLRVVVNDVFISSDGSQAAIQWDWAVTRRRDGLRGVTHDAILVHLVRGRISSWREYFDFGDSVDAKP
jgi:uncharacterized protein (TIGR02246 family)